jgi:hypothetical protein
MKATPQDYEIFLAGLTEGERELLAAEGITGPPEDGAMPHSGHFEVRAEDGLPSYNKNGGTRVPDPLAESHREDDPEAAPDRLRDDLAEGLRRVFLWCLAGMGPTILFKKPQVLARRVAILARILGLNGFSECTLADLGRHGEMTRAAFSKIAVDFRDQMGAKFLRAPGDREHIREASRIRTRRAWAKKRATA